MTSPVREQEEMSSGVQLTSSFIQPTIQDHEMVQRGSSHFSEHNLETS